LLLHKFVVGKTLDNCYSESLGNCDYKSGYTKRDL